LVLPDESPQRPADPREAAAALKQARADMLGALDDYRARFAQYDQWDTEVLHAEQAEALLQAHQTVGPEEFCQPFTNPGLAGNARGQASSEAGLGLHAGL
jgi:hypothetical protein